MMSNKNVVIFILFITIAYSITCGNSLVAPPDTNLNNPVFNVTTYVFNIEENSPAGTVLGVISAYDPKKGSSANLDIQMYRTAFLIKLEKKSNDRNSRLVVSTQPFDREALVNSATDPDKPILLNAELFVSDVDDPSRSSQAKVIVIVEDVNDNRPTWEFPNYPDAYTINVSRSVEINQTLTVVKASDRDSGDNARLRYSIVYGDPEKLFQLDAISGVLRSQRNLRRTNRSLYSLKLRVTDGGSDDLSIPQTRRIAYNSETTLEINLIDIPDDVDSESPKQRCVCDDAYSGGKNVRRG